MTSADLFHTAKGQRVLVVHAAVEDNLVAEISLRAPRAPCPGSATASG